ncbi:DUF4297 domain-containing protein [Priestia flexa]|uniref:dsDNA nuclease domain-containing protein n=1 Tax=Priestia flexa TaxID=86664 RepID=UPI0020A0053C|nr:dsDNA nuclease domain-containing protein [Priestia flexa]MCP1187836.1 DUF4297 domain-containing protein [Priestia flexa]
MTQKTDIDIRSRRINELKEYIEKEKVSIDEEPETIIDKLMSGKLRDIGGLTAIRGFVYQYYVAIYYMIRMIYKKTDSWWNYVVIEYFDDVTLLSETDVRFIQVKTIRENTGNTITPSNFYERTKPKEEEKEEKEEKVDNVNNRTYFNSWLDKLFFNYDYFIEKHLEGTNLEKDKYSNPQFELTTNSPFSSINKLAYATNSEYNLGDSLKDKDKFLEKLKSVKIGGTEVSFNQVMMKDLKFYLNRLFIQHLGSSIELKTTIIEMIMETLDTSDIENYGISEHIFNKFFSKVFSTTYSDDPNISLADLTFSKEFVIKLFDEGRSEGAEILANAVKHSTAFSMFDRVTTALANDINSSYKNEKVKKELLDTLKWFYNSCLEEFEKDPKYLLIFLNKLFEMEHNLPVNNYINGDNEYYLKNSIEYIVNCLAFYLEKKLMFTNASLLFHSGELNSQQKLLFTIHNAQNKKDTVSVKNSIATAIQYCEVTKRISEDFYCLILDDIEPQYKKDEKIAALFGISSIEEEQPKLIEQVNNLVFFNNRSMHQFILMLKQAKEDQPLTLRDEELVKRWREIVEEVHI